MRVALRSCARRGAAIDVVLDRACENRSQIVFTLLGAYACAGRLWVLAHPPHPDTIARGGPDACWPLSAPPIYLEDRQYWLLTELDPTTLPPLISHLVPHRPRHLGVDGHGTVWLLADGLRRLPAADGATATPLHLEHLTPSAQLRHDRTGPM